MRCPYYRSLAIDLFSHFSRVISTILKIFLPDLISIHVLQHGIDGKNLVEIFPIVPKILLFVIINPCCMSK